MRDTKKTVASIKRRMQSEREVVLGFPMMFLATECVPNPAFPVSNTSERDTERDAERSPEHSCVVFGQVSTPKIKRERLT